MSRGSGLRDVLQSLPGGDQPCFDGGDFIGGVVLLGLAFELSYGGLGGLEGAPASIGQHDLEDPTVRGVSTALDHVRAFERGVVVADAARSRRLAQGWWASPRVAVAVAR